jgi:hypothetical protein
VLINVTLLCLSGRRRDGSSSGYDFPNPTSGVFELGNNFQYPIIVNNAVDTLKNDDIIIIHHIVVVGFPFFTLLLPLPLP